MGVERFLTASALAGVVAQRLMRVLCPNCKRSYTITRDELLSSIPDFPLEEYEDEIELYHARGCMLCNQTGYKGRIGIYEFLQVDETMQRMIVANASTNEIKEHAVRNGMMTMRLDGLHKVKKGLSTIEELLRVIV
jgi:type IV pilus assembly protein PilB